MDMEKFAVSDYITVEEVNMSKTKEIVFINSGEEKTTDYGQRLRFLIELDQKQKYLTANMTSVKNLVEAFGSDSNAVIGKRAILKVEKAKNGKDTIIVYPIKAPEKETTKD